MGEMIPLVGKRNINKDKKPLLCNSTFQIIGQKAEKEVKLTIIRKPVKKLNPQIKSTNYYDIEKLKDIEKRVRKYGKSTRIYYRLSDEYLKLKCVDEAISCLERVVEIDPKDGDAYLAIADCCNVQYNLEKENGGYLKGSKYLKYAGNVIQRAINEFPNHPELYWALSTYYDFEDKDYIRSLIIGRDLAYRRIDKEKKLGNNEDIDYLKDILAEIEYDLLAAYDGIRDFKSVIDIGTALENRNDNCDTTYEFLGKAYKECREYDKAKAAFEKAFGISKYNSETVNGLTDLYLKDGEFEKAWDCLNIAIHAHKELGLEYSEYVEQLREVEVILKKNRLRLAGKK